VSTKHRGRFEGEPVTHQLLAPAGGVKLETFVPWQLVLRGTKREVIAPPGVLKAVEIHSTWADPARTEAKDSALMRALGLAHHWQRLLDEGRAASVAEIAKAEGVDVTHVRRVMRLGLLAPEVVERLVSSADIALEKVMRRPWPNGWCDQMRLLTPNR